MLRGSVHRRLGEPRLTRAAVLPRVRGALHRIAIDYV